MNKLHVSISHLSGATARLGFLCSRAKGSRALLTSLSKAQGPTMQEPRWWLREANTSPKAWQILWASGQDLHRLGPPRVQKATTWKGPRNVLPENSDRQSSRGNGPLDLLWSKSKIAITNACTAGSSAESLSSQSAASLPPSGSATRFCEDLCIRLVSYHHHHRTLHLERKSTEGNVIWGRTPLPDTTLATLKEKASSPGAPSLLISRVWMSLRFMSLTTATGHLFIHQTHFLLFLGRTHFLDPCALGYAETIRSDQHVPILMI